MNRYVKRGWRPTVGALAVGAIVFGLSLQGAPAGDSTELTPVRGVESAGVATSAAVVGFPVENTNEEFRPQRLAAPSVLQNVPADDPGVLEIENDVPFYRQARIIESSPVGGSSGDAGAARGGLPQGMACSCDEDCDPAIGDQCNIVQCIVRGLCTGDGTTLCSSDEDCAMAGGVCDPGSLVQRCDKVPLIDWECETGNGYCEQDRCEDDGSGDNSICVAQTDGGPGGNPLSPCAKECNGGPNVGQNCGDSGDCPGVDGGGDPAACVPVTDGACDDATESCYVDPTASGLIANAIGRCCDGAGGCTGETTEAACAGDWYRYRSPRQVLGNTECECPKYSSGVTPEGTTEGTTGLVRPSGLICDVGSQIEVAAGRNPIDCEDLDGNGVSERFCQKRCVGGDNATAVCQADINCALVGTCTGGGAEACVPALLDADCPGGETCTPNNPGTCLDDPCISNAIEGGCEDGFLNIADDYSLVNGSFLRLTQFRFRGGIANQGEDMVFEVWDSTNTHLIEAWAVSPGLTGERDWAVELDCWPNCDPILGEVPEPNPVIIPPTGILKLRSPRTIGTIDGSAAIWSRQAAAPDVGTNNPTLSYQDDVAGDYPGTDVYIFEFLGVKVDDPTGACCDDAASCEDTLRWECGLCSDPPGADPIGTVLCASTLHDCPQGGLTGSFCQINQWFGPVSHIDFEFGCTDCTDCVGIAPCNSGACCDPIGGTCTVLTEADCITLTGDAENWLGIATDCSPNCCPQPATGSDCACETRLCRADADDEWTTTLCTLQIDCENNLGPGFDCEVRCTPNGTEQLRLPYSCHDDFGTEVLPQEACDPGNGDADCTAINALWTCEQSFTTAYSVVKTDTITPDFTVDEGEVCSLNTVADNVGWFELFDLVDLTPGDSSDDCFHLTIGLCCTDPLLTPIWPFVSQYLNCPCSQSADIDGIAPDFDEGNNQLAGFGPNSLARIPCEDGNYAQTITLAPGPYGYQINSATNCAGSTIPCDDDTDCPGTSCVVPNPEYVAHFSVESCQIAACCLADACIQTNELDCAAQGGAYLGKGENPITLCPPQIPNPCAFGSCCVDGNCLDDPTHDERAECEGDDGIFVGGILSCDDQPCAACPIDSPANCQQVQTVFGPVPLTDRNTSNGQGGAATGITRVLADDMFFDGTAVDDICWNVGMFTPGIGACVQSAAVDTTWEIRIYEDDVSGAIPGTEICFSTISVLNKIAGTGQASNNWHYSGRLDTTCNLPNGGPGGDKYWFEISAIGDTGCAVRATWSRDHGNEHAAWEAIDTNRARLGYSLTQVLNLDVGFCEDDGITFPGDVLGACCTCPGICTPSLTQSDCLDNLRGVWLAATDCTGSPCPGATPNDDCANATPISGVPDDGTVFVLNAENICATDDGPPLTPGFGLCGQSITGNGEMHDDIWYAYTAEHCGTLRITSCQQDSPGADADNDQMIAIYDASGGCPVITADEIACNDDGCTGGGSAGPSRVELDVVEGQEVLVRVGGWNDEVPGGFNGDPRGFMEMHWSFTELCPAIEAPLPAPAPHNFPKNRYISLDTATSNPGAPQYHIKFVLTATGVAGAPLGGEYWAGDPDANCLSIVTTTKPGTAPNWAACPTAHFTGCGIIPVSDYDITGVSTDDVESASVTVGQTQPLPAGGKIFGDCVGSFDPGLPGWLPPQGIVNIDDAVAAIRTFQNPAAVNATHVSVTDFHPIGFPLQPFGTPNLAVDINDVFAILQGFQGLAYPGPDLNSCP